MTNPRRYALRMVVFLAVIVLVAMVLHQPAARFFMRNPPLNTLILAVLALGIGLSFRTVLSLEAEIAWLRSSRRNDQLFATSAPPLLGPLAAVLEAPRGWSRLTATTLRGVLDGVDSRLDERRDTSRYLVALLIFLGLLGTFWGLLLTASSVGETIRGLNVDGADPAQVFATLRAGLEAPLAGMGTAFSTSLFGLASSLVLGFLDLQASQAQNRFANELETWLSGLVGAEGDGATEGSGPPLPSYVTALLQQTAENLDRLERRTMRATDDSESLVATLRELGNRLTGLTDALRPSKEPAAPAGAAALETRAVLERMAQSVERHAGTLDETMGAHARNLERVVAQLLDDAVRGRERAVEEIRNEIRLLARTLSAIADRDR